MAKRGHKKQRRSVKKSGCGMPMWGGAGAADHAIAVYGGIGQQHTGNGNVIAQTQVGGSALTPASLSNGQIGGSAPLALSPAQIGGSKHIALSPAQIGGSAHIALSPAQIGGTAEIEISPAQDGSDAAQVGGLTGTELAVPAVLLVANQTFRKRGSSKKRRSQRRRRSNRRR
jgi:hypothetical protein